MDFETYCIPQTIDDLLFADPKIEQAIRHYAAHTPKRHLVLYGTYGTGKTRTAEVLLRTVMKLEDDEAWDQFVLEASDFRDSEQLMGKFNLAPFLSTSPNPIVLINEADVLSKSQMNELHAFMNKYTDIGRLILTTNQFAAMPGAIQSRSLCLELKCPTPEQMLPKAQAYLSSEGLRFADKKVLSVLNAGEGDLRNMINDIQMLHDMSSAA